MSRNLIGELNPLAPQPKVADNTAIRNFVRDLSMVAATIKDAREDYNEAVKTNEEVISIDEKIKALKEERKDVIMNSSVIQGYQEVLDDATEVKRQLISDAKQDGVPRKEIDEAIKMLKGDIDPQITTEIYANISDLVD